jgi:hypothetical protein
MTKDEYAKHRRRLKDSHAELSPRLGVTRVTSWKYETGALPVPLAIGFMLKSLKVRKK